MIRAAVIGLGAVSGTHRDAIESIPGAKLCAVCDIDEKKRSKVAEEIPFYQDYHEMIMREKPDCVHVCLPHYLHVPVSCEIAERGIPVFCEKPVGLNLEDARKLAECERRHPGIPLGICLQNRRNKTTEVLKKLVESKEYGRMTGCRALVLWSRPEEYYKDSPWRGKWATAGGGCLINQAIHTLDLLYFLCGKITALKASASQLLEYGIEVEDTALANLYFENGTRGFFLATNANSRDESVKISVFMEKAELRLTDNKLYRVEANGKITLLCEDEVLPGSHFYYGVSHRKVIAEFYDAIENGTNQYIHVKDAIMSMRLVDAMQKSSGTGEKVELEQGILTRPAGSRDSLQNPEKCV